MFEVVMQDLKILENATGANAKKARLRNISPLTQRVFEYALDPYKTFGVLNFTGYGTDNQSQYTEDDLFRNLDLLVNRTITGNAARAVCANMVMGGVPQELLQNILKKDLRCGVAAKTYNSVYPGAIPTFEVALAREYEDGEASLPRYESTKYDGFRCIAHVTNTGVRFFTRNGLEIMNSEAVKPELLSYSREHFGSEPMMFDGELMIRDGHFQKSSSALRKGGETQAEDVVYLVFDLMRLENFINRESQVPQSNRLDFLNKNPAKTKHFETVTHTLVHTHAEVMARYKAARERKQEGLILKDPQAPYQFKRSNAWLKLKDQITVDLRVIGIQPGKGKYTGMVGALVVDFNGKPNEVGTGLSDEDRKRTDWPDKIVEVAYHELTQDGNMRHARLIQERIDKREV